MLAAFASVFVGILSYCQSERSLKFANIQRVSDLTISSLTKVRDCLEQEKALSQKRQQPLGNDNPFKRGCALEYQNISTYFDFYSALENKKLDPKKNENIKAKLANCGKSTRATELDFNYGKKNIEEFNEWLSQIIDICQKDTLNALTKIIE